MILVTGAAGKTGRAVIRALAGRGAAVRAYVRRDDQAATVREAGAREVSVGDLADAARLGAAMQGVSAVYFITPNMSPDEVALAETAIAAASAAALGRFVYHSVLRPQIEAMPHHWQKLRVEERLFASGLEVTVLQPAPYMQNLLPQWPAVVEQGVFLTPYSAAARMSFVDLDDLGAAAAKVLTELGYGHATYEIAGTSAMTGHEVAEELSQALGRRVRAEAERIEEWERRAGAALPDYALDTLIRMFRYYDRHGLPGNPNALAALLGRVPMGWREFAIRQKAAGPG